MREDRFKQLVADAIRDAIVVECHTHETYQLDYLSAAKAAIRKIRELDAVVGTT
jgi:hypothetical protein